MIAIVWLFSSFCFANCVVIGRRETFHRFFSNHKLLWSDIKKTIFCCMVLAGSLMLVFLFFIFLFFALKTLSIHYYWWFLYFTCNERQREWGGRRDERKSILHTFDCKRRYPWIIAEIVSTWKKNYSLSFSGAHAC